MKQLLLAVCILGFLGGIAFPIRCHAEAETFVLVEIQEGKDSFEHRFSALLYTEALRRLGYRLELQHYPAARASLLSDNGAVDGEISRSYDYNSTHPNLIRVEEANFTLAFTAYAVKPGICLEGWKSIGNTGYRVEYRLGSKRPGNILPRMVDNDHLSRISTMEQGLKKLLLGRTDVYIDVESIVLVTIRDLKRTVPQAAAIYKAGVMERFTAHAFLHKKNAPLVPRLNDILKAMKKEGLIELYRIKAKQESSP